MAVNVFKLGADGSLKQGYLRTARSIRIRVPRGREVSVPFHPVSPPRFERGLLLEARPETLNSRKVLASRGGCEKALVVVDVGGVEFSGSHKLKI